MSESTSNILCAKESTIKENSELNVFNEMPHIIKQTKNTDENMEISDDESTITIGELSVDEYFDDIKRGKQFVHSELYCAEQNEQNEQSESSNNVNSVNNVVNTVNNVVNTVNNNVNSVNNNVNSVNNEDSDYDEENLEGEAPQLIINDIHLSLPTIIQVNRHSRAHIRENTHVQSTHNRNNEHILKNSVCYRKECNNLVMPIKPKPRKKPRAAAIEAAAKIAKSGKRFHRIIKIYYSCGHPEKIGSTPLRYIGIKTPKIMKQSLLLDERLMKTHYYLVRLPALPTVNQILEDFQILVNVSSDVMNLILTAFNYALPVWCLYYIEKRQYNEIIKRYPNREMSDIYGYSHLLRFIAILPRLYHQMRPYRSEFCVHVTEFMNRFMDYLVEQKMEVDIEDDYKIAKYDYHRLTYWTICNQ